MFLLFYRFEVRPHVFVIATFENILYKGHIARAKWNASLHVPGLLYDVFVCSQFTEIC